MNQSESPMPEHDNPYAPPATKTGSKPDWRKTPGRSRVMLVLFVVIGLISLIPPLTLFSLFCGAIGFACLAIGRNQLVNFGSNGLSLGMILLLPGFLLTGAVMFGGTCNAVVWPVVLFDSRPNWNIDWLYDFLGPHLIVGMIAGGVMALVWIAWFVADARSGPDPLQEKLAEIRLRRDSTSASPVPVKLEDDTNTSRENP